MTMNIKLSDMNYDVYNIKPGTNQDHYTYTFTSGHKLTVYETFAKAPYRYMVSFRNPNNNKCGESGGFLTAEMALEEFKKLFNNGNIRKILMDGFAM